MLKSRIKHYWGGVQSFWARENNLHQARAFWEALDRMASSCSKFSFQKWFAPYKNQKTKTRKIIHLLNNLMNRSLALHTPNQTGRIFQAVSPEESDNSYFTCAPFLSIHYGIKDYCTQRNPYLYHVFLQPSWNVGDIEINLILIRTKKLDEFNWRVRHVCFKLPARLLLSGTFVEKCLCGVSII